MKSVWSHVILLSAFGVAAAQQPGGQANSVDDKFVKGARAGNQFEIQVSKLALQRATDPDVKQFAQRMIDEHTKLTTELNRIAVDTSRSVPQLDPVHAALLNKLSNEQGKDFDECYIGMQVLAHEEALMCFRKQAKKGENAQLRAFAEKNLPVLREHSQLARKMCDNRIDGGLRETLKPDDGR